MYEINKQKFGAFVSKLRKEKGYTQKDLARQLYISDKAVSKWETGVSIPDTALLIPLAELLGVTVTELLLCQRQEKPMEADTVEQVVKTALCYSESKPERAYQKRSGWMIEYVLSLLLGLGGVYGNVKLGVSNNPIWTALLLSAIFGGYFCFFVPTKLPELYDQHRIGLFYDGVFRMNVPGLSFHNRNWPHIITVIRAWACISMVGFPLLNLAAELTIPSLWKELQLYVLLACFLGGLFVPVYVVGKRYE